MLPLYYAETPATAVENAPSVLLTRGILLRNTTTGEEVWALVDMKEGEVSLFHPELCDYAIPTADVLWVDEDTIATMAKELNIELTDKTESAKILADLFGWLYQEIRNSLELLKTTQELAENLENKMSVVDP